MYKDTNCGNYKKRAADIQKTLKSTVKDTQKEDFIKNINPLKI